MDVSLFKRLSEAHPQAVVNLEFQYRMNADIMLLSNTLVYNHRLRCGTPAVAEVT
jgi:DNA replication ATP-dependent helicase Dna2